MKNQKWFPFIFIVVFLCMYKNTLGANILYISATSSPSHNFWDKVLAIGLRDKGHHITFVTLSNITSEENFTTIILEGVLEKISSEIQTDIDKAVDFTVTDNLDFIFEWMYRTCKIIYSMKSIQKVFKLAKDGSKFDLIMFDIATGICHYAIAELFNYPTLVGTSPFGIPTYLTSDYEIHLHIAYIPHMTLKYTKNMNFFQKIYNFYVQIYEMSLKNIYWKKYKNFLDNIYGRDTKYIYEIEKNFSLLLTNYDPILETPRPIPPNVIPVGGLHVARAKNLPEDLQTYVDNSKNGVVIFSLGTNIQSDKLNESKKKAILAAFAQLQQNVIWKFESDISNLPKNVITKKYLPQNDLLAHPNVKLLINHGGSLSSQEAMYHGVPLIAIPFFADQNVISSRIANKKIGSVINYSNITSDYLASAIKEVIMNPIYKENIQKLSKQFRDLPDTPLDRAVFWVEYAMKHGGTHLRTPARYMSFFKLELLDIWIAIIIGVVVIFFVIKKFIVKRKRKVD